MTSPPREPGAIPLLSHWAGQLCKGTAVLAIGTVLVTMALCLLAWVLRMSSLAFYGRMLAAAVWLMLSAAYGIVASLVLQLFGLAGLSQWTTGRAYKWAMWCTTGVGFEIVNGAEYLKAGPAVYIANHQT